jgi:hypothetical protein
MTERERDRDPYWTADLAVGEGTFYQQSHLIRLQLHQSEEHYYHREELFPLKSPSGTRLYFHAKPYLALPDVRIGVTWEGGVGRTDAVTIEGSRKEVIGQAQGWYYPREKALMLWECIIDERHRLANAVEDENLDLVWRGFERELVHRSPGVKKLFTTWEDLYPRELWRRFLAQHGYTQTGKALFAKGIVSARAY